MKRILLATAIVASTIVAAPAAYAAGDAVKGKATFAVCAACHKADASGKSTIGPNLYRIVGRKAGTYAGFAYSAAMKGANRVWTEQNLDVYLTAPQKAVPGNRMPYAGLKDPVARANVIAYLKTVK